VVRVFLWGGEPARRQHRSPIEERSWGLSGTCFQRGVSERAMNPEIWEARSGSWARFIFNGAWAPKKKEKTANRSVCEEDGGGSCLSGKCSRNITTERGGRAPECEKSSGWFRCCKWGKNSKGGHTGGGALYLRWPTACLQDSSPFEIVY